MNVVYLVTNVRNGKQYVGVTKKGLEKRKREHLWVGGTTRGGLRFMFVDGERPPRKRWDGLTEEQKEEAVRRNKEALWRGIETNSKPVRCEDCGTVYNSISEAARAHKAHVSLVSAAIYRKGRAMKHKFEFVAKTHGLATTPTA